MKRGGMMEYAGIKEMLKNRIGDDAYQINVYKAVYMHMHTHTHLIRALWRDPFSRDLWQL